MRFASLRARITAAVVLGLAAITMVLFSVVPMVHSGHYQLAAHTALLFVVAVLLLVGALAQFRSGFSSFVPLRANLLAVREGGARRIDGRYPSEVQPLVDDLNALLDDRDARVARAIAKAGDLAHGLKTPLAILQQEVARAEAAGQTEIAASLQQQVARMRRQVDYHLAHARAAASGADPSARCQVLTSVDGLVRTLHRLYAERRLQIDVAVASEHTVRATRVDLDEMLGNLLDNACKWAASRVVVSSTAANGHIVIDVDDDGRGLEASMREAVLKRGVRADEAAPGSGLGLGIVRDLVELHGGSIVLGQSPLGGVRATLSLSA